MSESDPEWLPSNQALPSNSNQAGDDVRSQCGKPGRTSSGENRFCTKDAGHSGAHNLQGVNPQHAAPKPPPSRDFSQMGTFMEPKPKHKPALAKQDPMEQWRRDPTSDSHQYRQALVPTAAAAPPALSQQQQKAWEQMQAAEAEAEAASSLASMKEGEGKGIGGKRKTKRRRRKKRKTKRRRRKKRKTKRRRRKKHKKRRRRSRK